MEFLPVNILQIVFASISLFGALLVLKNERLRALAVLLIAIAGQMLFNILEETAGFREVLLASPAFLLIYPPLFYLFSRSLIFADKSLNWKDAPHFILFGLGFVFSGQFEWVKNAALASTLVYLALTLHLVHSFHKVAPKIRSDARSIRLIWLYVAVIAYSAHTVFDLMRMHLGGAWPWLISHDAYFLSLSFSLCLVMTMLYLAVQHNALFEGLISGELDEAQARTGENATDGTGEFSRLEAIIQGQELHAEPRLSLAEVSTASGIEAREISRLIKQATGKNFNDYINSLRVAEVCRRLRDGPGEGTGGNLLDIAFYCGFNSKSAFNDVFKKHTGQTPSAYLANLPSTASF